MHRNCWAHRVVGQRTQICRCTKMTSRELRICQKKVHRTGRCANRQPYVKRCPIVTARKHLTWAGVKDGKHNSTNEDDDDHYNTPDDAPWGPATAHNTTAPQMLQPTRCYLIITTTIIIIIIIRRQFIRGRTWLVTTRAPQNVCYECSVVWQSDTASTKYSAVKFHWKVPLGKALNCRNTAFISLSFCVYVFAYTF